KITTATETLTARDSITFSGATGGMTAKGDATVRKGARSLTAPVLTAETRKGAGGGLTVTRVRATGGVTIDNGAETVTGADGVYDVATQTAELTGGVRIVQGQSFLEGARA